MNVGLKYVFEKMCTYVNVNIEDIDFQDNNWYENYEWTENQQKDFTQWLAYQFRNNNNVRKDVTKLSYRPSKIRAESTANWFILYCGWKLKKEI